MQEKVITETKEWRIFIAEDGTQFNSPEAAERHEREMAHRAIRQRISRVKLDWDKDDTRNENQNEFLLIRFRTVEEWEAWTGYSWSADRSFQPRIVFEYDEEFEDRCGDRDYRPRHLDPQAMITILEEQIQQIRDGITMLNTVD